MFKSIIKQVPASLWEMAVKNLLYPLYGECRLSGKQFLQARIINKNIAVAVAVYIVV
jgi:hypothetical protein